MTFLFFFLWGCADTTPQTYSDLLNSKNCPPNDTKCMMEECSLFFKSPPKAEQDSEKTSLFTLCSRLDEKNTAVHQACGMSACFLLPELHPEGVGTILQKNIPLHASERIARQTIIRGLMEHNRFTSFLEQAPQPEKWLTIAVSEALCEESSSAKQLNIQCASSNPSAAQAAWAIAEKLPAENTDQRSALNLAMILDSKGIAPLLLSLLFDESMPLVKRTAAAQALHLAQFRGYTINPDFAETIVAQCTKGDPAVQILCR